jgi:hypothetical protein
MKGGDVTPAATAGQNTKPTKRGSPARLSGFLNYELRMVTLVFFRPLGGLLFLGCVDGLFLLFFV